MLFKNKKISIKIVENPSAYVIMNRKRHNAIMRTGNFTIGSSINAAKTLSLEETAIYLPQIVNIKADSPSFSQAVKLYWSGISVPIPENGKDLEIGFMYETEEKAKQGEAATESTKYKFGFPINVEDYILYRYCLVYGKVANTYEDRAKSNNIIFYIEDRELQLKKQKALQKLEIEAMEDYLQLIKDKVKTNYVASMLNIPSNIDDIYIIQSLIKKEMQENPSKFVNICNDELLQYKCVIKDALLNSKSPISQPSYSDVIMYKGDTLAKSVEDLAVMFNAKQHVQLFNELKTLTKE